MTWDSEIKPSTLMIIYAEEYPLDVGAPFTETVKQYARDVAQYSKFRVFITENGIEREVRSAEDAPAYIREGMEISIRPYEKAA